MARKRQQVGQLSDRRERLLPHDLHRHALLVPREIELDRLREARQIRHAQHRLVLVLAQVREHLAVARLEEAERAAAEGLVAPAHRDESPRPLQQRRGAAQLRLHVHRLVAVDGIHDRREIEPLRIGAREAGVAVRAPLHRRAHAVAVAEVDVVAHADLVAVVEDRRARHRHEEERDELDPRAAVLHERRQAPADADVHAHARVAREDAVHVVALAVGHHLERELVVVPEEDRPLAVRRDGRRLPHDLGERMAVLHRDRHVEARHHREVVRHVALVAVAEVLAHVLGPLVRLREQHPPREVAVEIGADLLDDRVRLRQVLVPGAFALDEVRDRIEAEAVHAHAEPEVHRAQHRAQHVGIVEVQVGLVAEETVPVVLLRDRIPRPVRALGVGEDDARARVLVGIVAPHVVVALHRAARRPPRRLEPRMLVRGVVHDELGHHAQPALVGLAHEALEVGARAVGRMHVLEVGDVVAVVAQRTRIERHHPDRVHAQVAHVVELLGETAEIADAVAVGIVERLHVELVHDRIHVPQRVGRQLRRDRGIGKVTGVHGR